MKTKQTVIDLFAEARRVWAGHVDGPWRGEVFGRHDPIEPPHDPRDPRNQEPRVVVNGRPARRDPRDPRDQA